MSTIQIFGAIEVGLIYGLVAMAVYLAFRSLQFPDLTVDGSFPLGGAVVAALIVHGFNPWFALIAASMAGFLSGLVTAWLTVRWRILNLLASILTMTALYSINLRIMGRPNIALLNETTIFSWLRDLSWMRYYTLPLMLFFIVGIILGILFLFLRSELGLAIRATGSNPRMARAQGVDVDKMTLLGIALSNLLVATAGGLFAQAQGFADVTMGVGTIIVGLASLIVGETLIPSRRLLLILISCVVGSIIYRFMIGIALHAGILGLEASDLNLVTAMLVAAAMVLPTIRKKIS